MGVQGLWSLVGPVARPTQLESLRSKRIAVDASIWIHQFMRSMRDKEGNALRNGHLLGFFRRICKLLFFDIKPVFVFDGGAPTLKRSTIRERRKRREGVRANLKVTAKKILSAQLKARVLMDKEHSGEEQYTYYDQLNAPIRKRKMDEFELPNIRQHETDARLQKLDPRLASSEEIQDFVNDFNPTEHDIDSEAFLTLPPEVQYEVIQDLVWKSRSTSGERLEEMMRGCNTALDFSKQQIKQLKHRSAMTQRLIQVNSAQSGIKVEPARVAGERGRQYILYKNEDINQGLGWKLPGLNASEPVLLDDPTPLHAEPSLEVPTEKESASREPNDKVAAAMASNPKLAALFDNFLSDDEGEDEDEESFEAIDTTRVDNEPINDQPVDTELMEDDMPLFLSETQGKNDLVNDMGAYVYDDEDDDQAINQVIHRMYQNEPTSNAISEKDDASLLSLSADEFYEIWLSRVPDAFMYLHSFNDEYKKILRKAIDEEDSGKIKGDLLSIRKQFGKTNEGDELALESLQFQQDFLESAIEWRSKQSTDNVNEALEELNETFEEVNDRLKDPVASVDETMMIRDDEDEFTYNSLKGVVISDDEDDQDIQFIESVPKKVTEPKEQEMVPREEHVHINIHQSNLRLEHEAENVNNTTEVPSIDESGQQADLLPIDNDLVMDKSSRLTNDIESNHVEDSSLTVELVAAPDHGYNSEEELDVQGEEDEYARFVSDIQSKRLDQVRTELYQDMKDLNKQQRKEMGNADDITDQMIQDIQELLKLFGVPFIVSPMEAEAQCSTLETLKLVDGTITDDSDVFLFGASRVYKNMFNQQRFVECYMSQDIEREMSLSRKKLIQLAFLLGSDYTEGIPGVGPVAAMEILAEFVKSNDGEEEEEESLEAPLKRFRNWYNSNIDDTPFKKKFRKRHNALDIPDDFPSPLVIDAYYHPTIDDSSQKFEWGQPQLDSLRVFLMEAFGWSEDKADQVLLPVLREMNSRKANGEQSTIGSFFNVSSTVSSNTGHSTQHKHSSKRVQSIVDNWQRQKRSKKK